MPPTTTISRATGAAFDLLQARVIDEGLCTHCGTCVGLSGGALRMQETDRGPLPVAAVAAPDLPDAAYEACPGKGLDYPDLCRFVFGHPPENWLIGCVRSLYIGHSRIPQIRRAGASGGVITQILLYLLERGMIDGAVVVRPGLPTPWEAQPVIAESAEEILAASQSTYLPVPVNVLLPQMAEFSGRLAYVGLPDQVAALRRLQQLGHPAAAKVKYVLGPYVGMNLYAGAIESFLRSHGIGGVEEITALRYRAGEWPGYLEIATRSGRVLRASKFYYNYLIPFYATASSLQSVDFTNELTDVSVGDAWHPQYEAKGEGFSVVVSRTQQADGLLEDMAADGLLALEPVSLETTLAMHGHMLDFKKRGTFIRLGWRRARGRFAPDFGYVPRSIPLGRRVVEVIVSGIFAAGHTKPARWLIERIPLAILGPVFNTARRVWKGASKPVKRRGLAGQEFEIGPALSQQNRSAWSRLGEEIGHWRRGQWTLQDVGAHWDATEDYDEINAATYSYGRRFTDGLRLSQLPPGGRVLDLCARTGNGTLAFFEAGKIGSVVCADVSLRMGEICRQRLSNVGIRDATWLHLTDYALPFPDGEFDAVVCFETVEHVAEPARLVRELGRVTRPGGTLVLTTPNVLWEPLHALAAVAGWHHSEGPHRFIRVPRLRQMVEDAGFVVTRTETTVLIPFGPPGLIRFGEWLESLTRRTLTRWLGLRRILIGRRAS